MIWGYAISSIIKWEVYHFGLSAVAGWLGYWSMSTILSRIGSRVTLPRRHTFLWPLLVALSCALLAHMLADYLDWF